MLWLIIIIIAYFLFSITSLGDKYLLVGPPDPKIYSFYVGALSILVLILAPFVGFFIPDLFTIIFCLFVGIIYLFAIFSAYQGLEYFEASRIIPALGGLVPIFTFLFIYLFSGGKEILGLKEMIAFALLVVASVLITYVPKKKIISESLKISIIGAIFFSLVFVMSKYVYSMLPFWTGFIWIRVGVFLTALLLLFSKKARKDVFSKKKSSFNKKTGTIFVVNQIVGAGAFVLQSWSVALVPLAFVSIINAMQGVQYIFLFIFTLFFLKSLREEISRRIIIQKVIAIIIIIIGLVIIVI